MNKSPAAARPLSAIPPRENQSNAKEEKMVSRHYLFRPSRRMALRGLEGASRRAVAQLGLANAVETRLRSPDASNLIAVTQGCSTDSRAWMSVLVYSWLEKDLTKGMTDQ